MIDARLTALGNDKIHGFGADKFDVGARGIEVRVVGNDIALLAGAAEKDALSGAALMGRDDVTVAENILDGITELLEAAASRVALVASLCGRVR
jgi:hypothetical protein